MKPKSSPARLPEFVEPMQVKLVDGMQPGEWLYEIKFDGYRAVALRGGSEARILSRNEKDLSAKFPKVRDSVAALDVQDAIIDYAASGIINVMPYADLRRTEHGVPPDEALSDAA